MVTVSLLWTAESFSSGSPEFSSCLSFIDVASAKVALGAPLGPIPPTGRPVRITGIEIWRFADGKVVELWNEVDVLGFMQQLGLIPAPEMAEIPNLPPLYDLEPGDVAVVAVPGSTDAGVIAFLDTLGLRPGVVVEVREKHPFDGPLVLRVDGHDRTVGEKVARQIYVEKQTQQETTRPRHSARAKDAQAPRRTHKAEGKTRREQPA